MARVKASVVDLTKGGYDALIRLEESLEKAGYSREKAEKMVVNALRLAQIASRRQGDRKR